jgi:hypothetical protein
MEVAGRGEEVVEEGYLRHLISPSILIGIQCPHCQGLFSMLEEYLGPAWQFLDIVKCHMRKYYLSYLIVEGLSALQL